MSDRAQLTPVQMYAAHAALAEFRLLYQAALDLSFAASSLLDVLDGYGIAAPAATKAPGWWGRIEALSEAVDQMAELVQRAVIVKPEFSAAQSVQSGDAGEGARALSPADPLRAAA